MTTTDSMGILYLEATDNITPFATTVNALQSATSNAVKKATRGPLYAANNTERNALLSQYGSSASNPLWVDVAGVLQRHNGTSWSTYPADVSWTNISLASGWSVTHGSRPAQYRVVGGMCELRGTVGYSGTLGTSYVVLGTAAPMSLAADGGYPILTAGLGSGTSAAGAVALLNPRSDAAIRVATTTGTVSSARVTLDGVSYRVS